jgi:hypothetical protein
MNVNLVCKVGFKILAAVIAGAAVVAGIDKAINSSKQSNTPRVPDDGNRFSSSGKTPDVVGQPEVVDNAPKSSTTDMILSGIRGAGETCGKLFTVAQSLSQLIVSAGSVFGGNNNPQQPMPGNGYYAQQQPYQSGNIIWVPAPGSNCVLQAVPADSNNKW